MVAEERRVTIVADPEVLLESLRRADALVEAGLHVIRERHEKAESMLRLGVATLAGLIAVVGLTLSAGIGISGRAWLAFWAGLGGELAGLIHFASLLVGLRQDEALLGPDVDALIEPLGEPRWTIDSLRFSLLLTLRRAITTNRAAARRQALRLSVGFALLMVGAALHLVMLAFIVAGDIR